MKIRTRFAPSPTGYLHVGGARTALFSWLHACRHGGDFVLRIEDTDRERSSDASVQAILDSLRWLGIDWDEGPYFQTDRMAHYREQIDRLLAQGDAYHCYCSREELDAMRAEQRARGAKPRYDGRCRTREGAPPAGRTPVVRFKNPIGGDVVVDDIVHGPMRFANDELDDLVIARADGTPTYNFTVVVDDLEMRITHVIRGDDHINNTPRQLNMLTALGATPPIYAHVPMILGPDGQRLSKRHGAVSVTQFRDEGFLPEALLNYLARLGWSHGDQEIFSREELCALFDVTDVNRAASVFDMDKLAWINQHYIKQADASRVASLLGEHLTRRGVAIGSGPKLEDTVAVMRERAKTIAEMADKSLFCYRDPEVFDEQAARKHLRPVVAGPLAALRERLSQLDEWSPEALHDAVTGSAEALGMKLGKLAQPLRVAITGSAASPGIEQTLWLVGQARTLARIDKALAFVATRAEDISGSPQ